jgi:hypothetical protein
MKRSFDLAIPNPRNGDDEIQIIVRCREVDNGIGAYEFWGATGVDTRMELEWELESCPIPDEEIYNDEKLCDHIQGRCEELWDECEFDDYEEREEVWETK